MRENGIKLVLLVALVAVMIMTQPIAAQNGGTAAPPPTNTPRDSIDAQPPATNTRNATFTRTTIPTRTSPPTRTPTDTRTPTNTRTPSATRTFTPSRTPTNTATRPPTMVIMGTYETPVQPPMTAIPPAAPSPRASGDDIVTVLLLGSDTITPGAAARTDVVILVSINRTVGSVSMMHIPRDVVVYAPNYTMEKINTIMNYGDQKYGKGGGAKLVKDTIQYNFGIKVDFYAQINFVDFQQIIAKLGGLEISVDCAIQGNRLKSPELDVTKEENYELYTLPVGYHKLTPYMALWYARARGSSSDYDRGRRQLDILRAMWQQAKRNGLFAQTTTLWPDVQKLVNTDMGLQDILGLIPMGVNLDPTAIQRINVAENTHFTQWYTADKGSFALLLKSDAWRTTMQNFVLPPPKNRLGGEAPTVEVGAPLAVKGYEMVAADRLAWEGFATKTLPTESIVNRTSTVIIDYTGNAKPSSREALMKILRVNKSAVIDKPDPNRTVDFRVEVGRDYGQCIWALPEQFQNTPAPTKAP